MAATRQAVAAEAQLALARQQAAAFEAQLAIASQQAAASEAQLAIARQQADATEAQLRIAQQQAPPSVSWKAEGDGWGYYYLYNTGSAAAINVVIHGKVEFTASYAARVRPGDGLRFQFKGWRRPSSVEVSWEGQREPVVVRVPPQPPNPIVELVQRSR